jgi:hypothetical protein
MLDEAVRGGLQRIALPKEKDCDYFAFSTG